MTICVIGSGWAAFSFLRTVKQRCTVISPRNHFVFTPLLASTAVGTLEHRCVVEPIRQFDCDYKQAECSSIDVNSKTVHYNGHDIKYDKLVMACGSVPNTFGIPGVHEHASFLRDVTHAKSIRQKILSLLEEVSVSQELHRLHFCIVGAGATGVEFAGELHDFVTSDILSKYPHLVPHIKMTLFDTSDHVLGGFSSQLSQYTQSHLRRKHVGLRLGTRIVKVHQDHLELLNGEMVPYGLLVWSTGVTSHPLAHSLDVDLNHNRIQVNPFLQMMKNGEPLEDHYAIGDCAGSLPQTAQVANQEGRHLGLLLNGTIKPFRYHHLFSMAYIGGWESVVDGKWSLKGTIAWILWRSAYLTTTVSLRNKLLIPVHWFTTWLFGRDVSHLK